MHVMTWRADDGPKAGLATATIERFPKGEIPEEKNHSDS